MDPTSGETLRGDELFADKQRLLLILEQMDYRTVSAFEQASKRAREFVQGRQIWRMLFKRDYLEIFHNAGGNNMSDDIKEKIDGYTVFDRKRREETYWKRYYEFLKKSDESLREFKTFRRIRDYPMGWRRSDGIRFVTPSERPEFDDFRESEWRIRHVSSNDTIYYYPLYVDQTDGTYIPESQKHPPLVIAISMENLHPYHIITWDPIIMNGTIIETRPTRSAPYIRSNDGFYWIKIEGAWIQQMKPSYPLVSQQLACSICDSVAKQLHSCECCGEVYCGRECQKVNH